MGQQPQNEVAALAYVLAPRWSAEGGAVGQFQLAQALVEQAGVYVDHDIGPGGERAHGRPRAWARA